MLGLILAEMRRLGAEPIPAAELTARRASLTGDFGRDVETTGGMAGLIGAYVHAAASARRRSSAICPRVLAVTPAEAQAAAAELIAPGRRDDGDRRRGSQFVERLRATGATVTVIPLAELNLDSAALR